MCFNLPVRQSQGSLPGTASSWVRGAGRLMRLAVRGREEVWKERGTGLPDYLSPVHEGGSPRILFLKFEYRPVKGREKSILFPEAMSEDSSVRNIDFGNENLMLGKYLLINNDLKIICKRLLFKDH